MRIHHGTIDTLSPRELHELYKLRCDVFVAEQQVPYAEIDDQDAAAETTHLLARSDDGTLLGCARVFPGLICDTAHLFFGRFAVVPSARGQGVAQKIMAEAIEIAGERPIYLTANALLQKYYAQYGFEVCGEVYEDTGVPHIPMRRAARSGR